MQDLVHDQRIAAGVHGEPAILAIALAFHGGDLAQAPVAHDDRLAGIEHQATGAQSAAHQSIDQRLGARREHRPGAAKILQARPIARGFQSAPPPQPGGRIGRAGPGQLGEQARRIGRSASRQMLHCFALQALALRTDTLRRVVGQTGDGLAVDLQQLQVGVLAPGDGPREPERRPLELADLQQQRAPVTVNDPAFAAGGQAGLHHPDRLGRTALGCAQPRQAQARLVVGRIECKRLLQGPLGVGPPMQPHQQFALEIVELGCARPCVHGLFTGAQRPREVRSGRPPNLRPPLAGRSLGRIFRPICQRHPPRPPDMGRKPRREYGSWRQIIAMLKQSAMYATFSRRQRRLLRLAPRRRP